MGSALVSAMSGIPLRKDVAMTGEITLRGRVLPIGGLKEKALAALRHGISNLIVPARNKKDLEDIPEELRKKLHFTFALTMDDVLEAALAGGLPFKKKSPSPAAGKSRKRAATTVKNVRVGKNKMAAQDRSGSTRSGAKSSAKKPSSARDRKR
jgi:predicted ATP-dependent protease